MLQITVAFDETTTLEDVDKLFKVFSGGKPVSSRSISAKPAFLMRNYVATLNDALSQTLSGGLHS
jgi:hypothetical protein